MVPINLVKRMTDHKIYKLPKHKIPFSERFPIIAIEGIDGAGKTTTASALAKMIKGHYIITPPDDYKRLRPFFELPERSGKARLLFYAGSLWDVWEDIRERCKVRPVVLDRYTLSTIFYHETLLEEDLSYIYDNIFPPIADINITLDVSEKTALSRLENRVVKSFDADIETNRALQRILAKKFKKYAQYIINTDLLNEQQVVQECTGIIIDYTNNNKSNNAQIPRTVLK